MIKISLCMIVKNEQKNMAEILNNLKPIADEMIVVDTGSADDTAEIARSLGAQVFTFSWTGSFADARNFAFSKASGDYIYSADADERLDEENLQRFLCLKECMDPQIDIVQMYYRNQLQGNTVYNFDRELRPKLFKRLRTFTWLEPVHEQVRLDPLVFDSDIEIDHFPEGDHASRDLAAFLRASREQALSPRLFSLYARELMIAGRESDFQEALPFFEKEASAEDRSVDEVKQACVIVCHAARLHRKERTFFQYALKNVAAGGCSEMCCELGEFYLEEGQWKEAALWFYNAAYETESLLDIHRGGDLPLRRLSECYALMGEEEQARAYAEAASAWKMTQQ